MSERKRAAGRIALGRTYELLLKMYMVSGFWKVKSDKKWKRYFYVTYVWVTELDLFSFLLLFLIDSFMKLHSLKLLLQGLYCLLTVAPVYVKVRLLRGKMKETENIKESLNNSWFLPDIGCSEEDRKILAKAEQEMNILFRVECCSAIFGCSAWLLTPILDYTSQERYLPMTFPEIFDFTKTPAYECLYAYALLGVSHLTIIVISCDLIYCTFLNLIQAQLDILAKNLRRMQRTYPCRPYGSFIKRYKDLSDEDGSWTSEEVEMRKEMEKMSKTQRTKQTLKVLNGHIRHHQAIIRELQNVNRIYGWPMFIDICFTAVLIAVVVADFLSEQELAIRMVQQLGYASYLFGKLFLFSAFGTRIIKKSDEVREAIFGIPWYEMEREPRTLVKMIQIKGLKPPCVTAGKMISIHLDMYLSLLQVTYNTIAVLLRMKK